MHKIYLTFFIVLILSCSTQPKIKKPFYYRVSKGVQTYYILGTMHAGFRLKDFPESIKMNIRESGLAAIEVSPEVAKLVMQTLQADYQDYYSKRLEHFPNLKKSFKKEAWERVLYTLNKEDVKKYLAKAGIQHQPSEIHPALLYEVVHDFANRGQAHVFHPDLLQGNTSWYKLGVKDEYKSVLDKEVR